jgi:hypothetical protein
MRNAPTLSGVPNNHVTSIANDRATLAPNHANINAGNKEGRVM